MLAVSATCVLYVRGYFDWWLSEFASGAGKFNPAMCGKAGMRIDSVSCAGKVVYVTFSNTGRMPLNGNFIAAVSTDAMQVFVANDTSSIIRPGNAGELSFAVDGLAGPVSKVTVTFQPCENVFAEKEDLFMEC